MIMHFVSTLKYTLSINQNNDDQEKNAIDGIILYNIKQSLVIDVS